MTAEQIRQPDIDAIDALDDDAFQNIIIKRAWTDPRNNRIWTMLCEPKLIERTAGCLDELIEELTREIDDRSLANGHPKVRLLSVYSSRLKMVTSRIARINGHKAAQDDDLGVFRQRTRELATAINEHRLACIAADLTPESHDVALWDVLDRLSMPDHGRTDVPSLAAMLAGPWSQREEATQLPSEVSA